MKMTREERLIFWFIVAVIIVIMLFLTFENIWLSKKPPEIPELRMIFSHIYACVENFTSYYQS